jgi:D-glycero-D-manno-heptose 1,7-bisphosphate phosphatase
LEDFEIFPDAPAALEELKAAGFLLIVVTNQPDVGAGKLSREILNQMHEQMRLRLPLDDIYVCIHTREAGCSCRKPQPGMLIAAARKWGLDLSNSYLIGDRSSDIEAARAVGCRSIFIDHNYRETVINSPDFRVGKMSEAASIVVRDSRRAHERG